MGCIFDNAWSQISFACLVRPETDQARLQRMRLAVIVTQLMKRREDSIDELVAAAFAQFRDGETIAE